MRAGLQAQEPAVARLAARNPSRALRISAFCGNFPPLKRHSSHPRELRPPRSPALGPGSRAAGRGRRGPFTAGALERGGSGLWARLCPGARAERRGRSFRGERSSLADKLPRCPGAVGGPGRPARARLAADVWQLDGRAPRGAPGLAPRGRARLCGARTMPSTVGCPLCARSAALPPRRLCSAPPAPQPAPARRSEAGAAFKAAGRVPASPSGLDPAAIRGSRLPGWTQTAARAGSSERDCGKGLARCLELRRLVPRGIHPASAELLAPRPVPPPLVRTGPSSAPGPSRP